MTNIKLLTGLIINPLMYLMHRAQVIRNQNKETPTINDIERKLKGKYGVHAKIYHTNDFGDVLDVVMPIGVTTREPSSIVYVGFRLSYLWPPLVYISGGKKLIDITDVDISETDNGEILVNDRESLEEISVSLDTANRIIKVHEHIISMLDIMDYQLHGMHRSDTPRMEKLMDDIMSIKDLLNKYHKLVGQLQLQADLAHYIHEKRYDIPYVEWNKTRQCIQIKLRDDYSLIWNPGEFVLDFEYDWDNDVIEIKSEYSNTRTTIKSLRGIFSKGITTTKGYTLLFDQVHDDGKESSLSINIDMDLDKLACLEDQVNDLKAFITEGISKSQDKCMNNLEWFHKVTELVCRPVDKIDLDLSNLPEKEKSFKALIIPEEQVKDIVKYIDRVADALYELKSRLV